MLSIEAFLFGNLLVHVQGVSGSFNDSLVVSPRDDNVSKKNFIQSLVVKYPYYRGYWTF